MSAPNISVPTICMQECHSLWLQSLITSSGAAIKIHCPWASVYKTMTFCPSSFVLVDKNARRDSKCGKGYLCKRCLMQWGIWTLWNKNNCNIVPTVRHEVVSIGICIINDLIGSALRTTLTTTKNHGPVLVFASKLELLFLEPKCMTRSLISQCRRCKEMHVLANEMR